MVAIRLIRAAMSASIVRRDSEASLKEKKATV